MSRSLQEISAAHDGIGAGHFAQGRDGTLQSQLTSIKAALDETNAAHDQLQRVYEDGVIRTPVAGYVGGTSPPRAPSFRRGKTRLRKYLPARASSGPSTPETYLFDLEPGERVSVKGAWDHRNRNCPEDSSSHGRATTRLSASQQGARNRGQVARITLQDPNQFAVNEKVRVTGCVADYCNPGLVNVVRSWFGGSRNAATDDLTQPPTAGRASE